MIQTRQAILISCLLLLAVGMFFGVAGQAIGLAAFGIIVPAFLLDMKRLPLGSLRSLGICLVVAYLVFVASNLWGYFVVWGGEFPVTSNEYDPNASFKIKKLFTSPISRGVLVSGIVILVLSSLPNKRNPATGFPVDEWFIRALCAASAILFAYCLFQYFTGFDYRLDGYQMPDTNLMSQGRYRAMGAYGHPLSLASASLALFSFSWSMMWSKISRSQLDLTLFTLLGIALFHLGLLVLSGGRLALGLGGLIFVAIPLLTPLPQQWRMWKIAAIACAVLGFAGLILGPLSQRFSETLTQLRGGNILGERIVFWQVHWDLFLERPWLGHGRAVLDYFLRESSYSQAGFAQFGKKYNAHNIYLEILTNVGILGTVLAGATAAKGLSALKRCIPASSKPYYHALLWAILANAIHGMTQNTFFDSNVIYVYLGLIWVLLWKAASDAATG